ncbi:MAG: translation initiation factor IF-2 [Puniceicoccales bacterium]|jgi:translation initiation factor IF-2|nr:translation initiation factor IF-2 [Puniceicoccales bacterium]
MSTRVYLLAKRLGISSRDLIEILRGKGFDVSSASSSVADIYAEDLLREFGKAGTSNTAVEPVADAAIPNVDSRLIVANSKEIIEAAAFTPQNRSDIAKPRAGDDVERPATVPILSRSQPQAAPNEPRRMIPLDRIQQTNKFGGGKFGFRGGGDRRHGGGNFGGGSRFGSPSDQRSGGQQSPSHPSGGKPYPSNDRPGERRHFSPGLNNRSGGERRHGQGGDFRVPPRTQQPDRKRPQFVPPPQRFNQLNPNPRSAVVSQQITQNQSNGRDGKALRLRFPMCVREFAPEIGLKPFQLISELMQLGIFASMNYLVDEALAKRIGEKLSIAIEAVQDRAPQIAIKQNAAAIPPEREAVLESRPPVVCVLGHVDHGKTTLLDRIRQANVVAGEAGGITQHIGAYEVETDGGKITFIDTPGHAAFSKMRERGANLTDIAVLVVAADDGFMPQTDEALKFVQRASVPVVVAINKVDAKGANRERVRQQMQQRGIAAEDWGGETLCCDISALNGDGIPRLLELILIQAEMLTLKADRGCPVEGVVLESQIELGRGPTASVIVGNGTLKIGDALVCGENYCKVKAIVDDRGKQIREALPSKPVKIVGWSGTLAAGSTFAAAASEKSARELAEACRIRELRGDAPQRTSAPTPRRRASSVDAEDLDALFAAIDAKQKRMLRIIIKGDVQGSVEALAACLSAMPQDKIGLEIIRSEVGPVSLGDVEFARPVGATIVAFNVKLENGVQAALKQHGIAMIQHNVIYMLIDSVRDCMADLLEPELHEEKLGGAQVRRVFNLTKGTIAGCMVTEGKVLRDAQARIWRDGVQLFDGKISSLRREKLDSAEVRAGYECGISVSDYDSYAVGDVIECYKINKIRQSL